MEITKIKPLAKEQLIISVDRLTRFKETESKYLRVFSDIITANLISPKLKKTEIEELPYRELVETVESIVNFSVEILGAKNENSNFSVNEKLAEYEKSVFNISPAVEVLLNNKIDYASILNLTGNDIPNNLKWLKAICLGKDTRQFRKDNYIKYPIEKIVIAEGATEEILLPEFAGICNYNFDREGVHLISAGGKNQVVKLYYDLVDKLKLPIFVLLDKDAVENRESISVKLRPCDKIHLLECGEFEDLLPFGLVKRTLEYELNNISLVDDILPKDISRVKFLEEVFKTRGMHEFKKVEFSQMVKKNIQPETDITPEIQEIITEIKKL